jgi:hypothetical protein
MGRCLWKLGLLACRVALGFNLISKLIELVEVDARIETEAMRDGLRCRVLPWLGICPETSAERPVDDLLERQPEFARPSLQKTGEIIINGERCAHAAHH